jgi:multidrug efflux pump subunit AcrA (membrane-fusion protein)
LTAPAPTSPDPVSALLHLEARARAAADRTALEFVVANETWQLAQYRQGLVLRRDALGRLALTAASGLAALEGDTPFALWVERLAAHLSGESAPRVVTAAEVPEALAAEWTEWLPAQVLFAPLRSPRGELLGAALYARDEPWSDVQRALLGRVHETYGHAAWALSRQDGLRTRTRAWFTRHPRWWIAGAALLAAALLIPVRMSVLAPAEVIALDAQAIAAPMDGVIKAFQVAPNQMVKRDDVLFTLDDTALAARRDVAGKALEVARADALLAAQKAFDNDRSRGELAVLQGKVKEREAELALIAQQLGRLEVRAPRDGIAVFGDPNDWVGRPVVTGERIAQLADPRDAGVLVWLPVADAINLEAGAEIRLFLHVAPLTPLEARLTQTSYQSMLSPEGVASYRVRGAFAQSEALARIGLKGTAKLYGERVPLGYVVVRRPLAAVREWTGW